MDRYLYICKESTLASYCWTVIISVYSFSVPSGREEASYYKRISLHEVVLYMVRLLQPSYCLGKFFWSYWSMFFVQYSYVILNRSYVNEINSLWLTYISLCAMSISWIFGSLALWPPVIKWYISRRYLSSPCAYDKPLKWPLKCHHGSNITIKVFCFILFTILILNFYLLFITMVHQKS